MQFNVNLYSIEYVGVFSEEYVEHVEYVEYLEPKDLYALIDECEDACDYLDDIIESTECETTKKQLFGCLDKFESVIDQLENLGK